MEQERKQTKFSVSRHTRYRGADQASCRILSCCQWSICYILLLVFCCLEVKSTDSSRIVGGSIVNEVANYEAFGIPYDSNALCGGVLIHEDFFLTVGHCFNVFYHGVRLGTTLRDEDNQNATEVIETEFQYQHMGYHYRRIRNDIMLIKLKQPAKIVKPMGWADEKIVQEGRTSLTVIGYGLTEDYSVSDELREVDVLTFSDQYCRIRYRSFDPEYQICAGLPRTGGKDSCQGDSGGPLIANGVDYKYSSEETDTRKVVGLVSYGVPCAYPWSPSAYTRVSAYKDWIESVICSYSSVPPDYCDELLEMEKDESTCPAKFQCGVSSDAYVTNRNVFGRCIERCTSAVNFSLFARIGFRCGPCDPID